MVLYVSVPLTSRKVYVPIQHAKFFEEHPKADWDSDKNDVHCPEHDITFGSVTSLAPVFVEDKVVYYDGVDHPRVSYLQQMAGLELNRNY